ncbi:hypothetical protein A0H76_2591 [Hepatospora eriocheir]|uniref:Uncharacterized protein n=1 Tax=Hepatospora eriocheir TaxID=1081669 RepID=A0A1X0QFA0_9MICR|nr:hypothetical protein A0H76_2591 [Hepatospora eriocheir]
MNEIDTIDNKETESSLLTLINDKEYKMAREDFYSNNLNRKNYNYFKPEIIKEDIKYKNITQKTNNTIWGEDTSIFNYNDIN